MFRTYADFVLLLRRAGPYFPWIIDREKCLRTWTPEGWDVDPLSAVCVSFMHRYFDPADYAEAGRALGLHRFITDQIAQASDLAESYNAHVRAELVLAIDLNERWAPEGRWHDSAFHAHPYPHDRDRPLTPGGCSVTTARLAAGQELFRCMSVHQSPPLPLLPNENTAASGSVATPPCGLFETTTACSEPRGPARGRSGYSGFSRSSLPA